MYGQSHMETYIPICKIDSRWQFTVYLRKLKQGALYQPSGVGWVGRWEGSSKRRGYMYTYGWFMLTFDRKRQNSVKQLSFSSVQLLSRVRLFATPWIAARQAFLFITNSWSLLKLMSIESLIPSNNLMLCCPLLLLPSIFPASGSFQWVNPVPQVAKALEFQVQHQSFQWIFRTYFL